MNAYQFRKLAGKWGAYVSGKKVRPIPSFPGRRLCRICSERLVAARIKAVLLKGESFTEAEKLTKVPDTSIIRHVRMCLDKKTQRKIESAWRAKKHRGKKLKSLQS